MEHEQSAALLKTLTKRRTVIKGQVTRLKTYLEGATDLSSADLEQYRNKLNQLSTTYNEVQMEIEIADDITDYWNEREQFEHQIYNLLSIINKRLESSAGSISTTTRALESPCNVMVKQANTLLPKIQIKPFDGNPVEWHSFHDTFQTLVHDNDELPAVQKFHLLKNSLRGEIASVVASLNATEQNYQVAWDLLKKRCHKPRQIIHAHFKLLLELPECTRDTPTSLRSLNEQAQMHVNALKALKQPIEHWDAFLVYILGKKLDKNTRRAWERTLTNEEMPKFETLIEFISRQARGDEFETDSTTTRSNYRVENRNRPVTNRPAQAFIATKQFRCVVCQEQHDLFQCSQFLKLNTRGRINIIKGNKLCYNCLRQGHATNFCKAGNCRKCDRKHNTLLHIEPESRHINEPSTSNNSSTEPVATTLTVISNSEVLLGTARVIILDQQGNQHNCRALLDCGSQTNFITTRLANNLNLTKQGTQLSFSGLGHKETHAQYFVRTTIRSRHSDFTARDTFIVLESITGCLPARPIEHAAIKLPAGLQLADPEFLVSKEIDILLGNSLFYQLISAGQIQVENSSAILQNTRLGWIVTGAIKTPNYTTQRNRKCHVATTLENQINRFWEIEELPDQTYHSSDEVACEQHFNSTVSRNKDGRYVVRLPFNNKQDLLGESREQALRRFHALERKLYHNTILKEQYTSFLREYQSLGHMREDLSEQVREGFYLPHHGVIKESSETTKLRVVFDASAKSSSGVSLNDTLLIGPTIQDTLFSILLRFRLHLYAFTADIEKMFRQINLHSDDTVYQKILWRESFEQPIKTFKLNTVTYGTASAPFLAVRVLKQLAEDEANNFPQAARVFRHDFYVDDLLTGASDFETAQQIRDQLIALAKAGGFNLRQWASNDFRLIPNLNQQIEQKGLCLDTAKTRKTLGIIWKSSNDTIVYKIQSFQQNRTITKRFILSQISQLFDPLGLIGPIIIRGKILIQQLWKDKITWDDSVPQSILNKWLEFSKDLPLLSNFSAPRSCIYEQDVQLQLHGFCDASEAAYGACIYVRSTNKFGFHQTSLLCAKSRVAPLKIISLPRLELCAARLLVKLFKEIKGSLTNTHFQKIKFWSDSTIVLHWIQTPPHLLKTFVANRVSEIQTKSESQNWSHVPTTDNPADIISRGQSTVDFLKNSTWLKGPSWLSQDENMWPKTDLKFIEVPEKRTIVSLTARQISNEILTRFSSITLLNRVVAYLLRFYNNTKIAKGSKLITGELSSEELQNAHLRIIKILQAEVFAQEIHRLDKDKSLNKESRILNLNPFIDEQGILRVGGRLKYAPLSYSEKHPILLPRKHHVTELIIRKEHIRHYHAGIHATINAVRQKYWPIDGKNTTRRIIHQCVTCYKANPKIPNYIMGNLPKSRVTQTRPFKITGLDYCGPFFIKEKRVRNRNKEKVYVAVFVCFVTKAVHLELVGDLTAEACLGAIKRFFGRRGKATHIYSDNATNFVGVKNEIHEIQTFFNSENYKNKIQHFLSDENITWHFSPPRSPHFGGLWEAAVKSFKKHLHKVIGQTLLTFEQFTTLIVDIEAILNSRPIFSLSSDPNDLTAVTPGHFLIGDSLTSTPEHDLMEVPVNRLSMWQHTQRMKQHFWLRWQKEYLQQLHTRNRWHQNNAINLKEGTLVTIRDEQMAPLQWKLGRILAVHPGRDNVVRVATIKTAHGVYKRGIKQLVPLPIE